ncbi:CAP domain-containing protein [Demequina sp. NBRC 110052]|uniref:CAP domain-containing protein n=1 Tax=Demequina sp. NBRC 110052 TaxID=1570341 RepID=UPI000A021A6C|nr:CAP domain-containing protein [Demequina sp. NBRC 110052]
MRRLPVHAALVVAASALLLAACAPDYSIDEPVDYDGYARELFDLTNELRVDEGLGTLEWNDCLAQMAEPRAQTASTLEYLEHEPMTPSCTEGNMIGENLVRDERNPAGLFDRWVNSASHYQNLVNPGWEVSGVACVPSDQGPTCSQLFEGVAPVPE